jgi:L-gulono-1,4-lactone dehydrogenase
VWRNWSGELSCDPATSVRPASTTEVVAGVEAARARGWTVRPVGSGHSFTPLVVTDGVHLDLGLMDAVLATDREAGRVRVQAGIRLGRLTEELARRGLAMENLGDIDRQTLAGALATGTHGTGAALGGLASQVESLQLVDGRGEVHELVRDRDGDRFLAAVVGLGSLGIVTEVTLRVVAAYTLRGDDRSEPLQAVLDHFHARAAAHRHVEFYAFPYSDTAWTRTNDVVAVAPAPRHPLRVWTEDRLLTTHGFEAACRLGARAPGAIPSINRVAARLAGGGVRVDASHRIFASARDVRFTEMELSLPREDGLPFVREVLALLERERFPVVFPIEVRTTAADDALLSTSHGRDSVYVAVHNHVRLPHEEYLAAVWELAQRYAVRPHWGKRHPAAAAELAPRYPAWQRFAAVRAAFDPEGRFVNDHLLRVLGPVGD